jgi:hypothetical protein
MKKFTLPFIFLFVSLLSFGQLDDTSWKLANSPNALGVGPAAGDYSWWAIGDGGADVRPCIFDDVVTFHSSGDFDIEMDGSTWVEPWQGNDPEGCATPVAPHDGSTTGTWEYTGDAASGELYIGGIGSFLGLAKVYNDGELSDPAAAVDGITYQVTFFTADSMGIDINYNPAGTDNWHFEYVKTTGGSTSISEVAVNNRLVYPTIAVDFITVDTDEEVSIINYLGQTVLVSETNEVNVSALASGVYFVRTGDQIARIIKQ